MKQVLVWIFVLGFAAIIPLTAAASPYSNASHDWYFKRSANHGPATTEPEYEALLNKYGGIFQGNTHKKFIYLTFDNGYEQGYTSRILDTLKKKQVPAAFFVTGHYLESEPDLVKRMVKEGHIVGNHSWSHPDFPTVGNQKLKRELQRVEDKYTEITGQKDMKYLRPPRGVFSERTLALTEKLGYTNVFWSLAFKDWERNNQKGWKYSYNNVMEQIHPGAIMLLHTVSKDNAEALPKIIDSLREKGYKFKSLDYLMAHRNVPEFVW
ncbi:MAG TPA: delta-lactam-biosynthetic de-N-acetylase [Bacillales bacterium]|nr:delta-lactam-biosynthetic de-N-acetylase [Bacillales bacterium]